MGAPAAKVKTQTVTMHSKHHDMGIFDTSENPLRLVTLQHWWDSSFISVIFKLNQENSWYVRLEPCHSLLFVNYVLHNRSETSWTREDSHKGTQGNTTCVGAGTVADNISHIVTTPIQGDNKRLHTGQARHVLPVCSGWKDSWACCPCLQQLCSAGVPESVHDHSAKA